MGIISVDSAGLAWLGTECEQRAAVVLGDGAAPAVSGGLSATAAAVRGVHGDVEEAARRIAARLQETAEAASSAASAFATTEPDNTDLLTDVGQLATVEV